MKKILLVVFLIVGISGYIIYKFYSKAKIEKYNKEKSKIVDKSDEERKRRVEEFEKELEKELEKTYDSLFKDIEKKE